MTSRERVKEIAAFAQLCFWSLPSDMKKVAEMTGLSLATIYRWRTGKVTAKCHIGTVQKLGMAANLQLVLTKYKAVVKVAG